MKVLKRFTTMHLILTQKIRTRAMEEAFVAVVGKALRA
jgi:hypothetical protein